jgi:hypothetical protein
LDPETIKNLIHEKGLASKKALLNSLSDKKGDPPTPNSDKSTDHAWWFYRLWDKIIENPEIMIRPSPVSAHGTPWGPPTANRQPFSPHFKTFGHERLDTDAFALKFVFVEHVRHLDERHNRYFYFGEWLWDSKAVPGLKPPIRTILDHHRH